MARRNKGRRCSFESLENRRLLAGDVTARIDHGKLVVNGDNLDNGITITAGANAGEVVVKGVDAGGSATNVNGTANGEVTLTGFTGGLKISMKDGDDSVTISGLTVDGKAKLKGGDGDDEFIIEDSTYNRSLRVRLGKGDDTLSITDIEVDGKTRIKGKRGEDDVTIDDSTFTKLRVSLGKDDDTLGITETTVTVKTRLNGGPDIDTFTNGTGNSLADLKVKNFEGPTLTISGPASVNEGALYTLALSSSGDGTDTISQWTIDWGDGTAAQAVSGDPASVTHTFADGLKNVTISATATNDDGTFAAGNTVAVTVNNVAPTLTLSGAASVNEGALYTLNLSKTDPGTDTIDHWTINWGDGTPAETVSGNPASVTHTFADGPQNVTISATATDEDGMFAAANTVAVTVNNVVPTLVLSGASSVNEGALYTLNLSKTDLGADTIDHWTINWGDGTPAQTVAGNPASVTHTFADGPQNVTISATATDEDGTFAAGNTVAVTVNNVAPTLVLSGAASVNEGALYTLNLSKTDPGTDTIGHWTINWGDGTPAQTVSGNPASVTHTFADGLNNFTISATATDEDGTFAAGNTVAVTVLNVSPTLAISGAASVNEGATYTLNLSSSDPGADTITKWTINWGNEIEVVNGNPTSVTHVYDDGPNNFTISATATDEDGTFAAGTTVAVTVNNVAPTVAITGPTSVSEGASNNWMLSAIVDPGDDTVTDYIVHWGDGQTDNFTAAQIAGLGGVISHTYDDGPNNYSILVDVVDEDGTHTSAGTHNVAVNNVAPTVAITGPTSVDEGDSNNWTLGAIVDPGDDTVTSYVVHWGDGDTDTFTAAEIAGLAGVVSHTYDDGPNNYSILVDVVDEDGTHANAGTHNVAVNNVAPTVAITGPTIVDEGDSNNWTLDAVVDPGTDTVTSYIVHWGDGDTDTFTAAEIAGLAGVISHTYDDGPNSYTIVVDLVDEDGTHTNAGSHNVTVNDVEPSLAISGLADIDEGSFYTLDLSSSDPGADTISKWTINWGDGSPPEDVAGNPANALHFYADGDADRTISATATNEDGTFAAGNTVDVTVHDVAPTLTISGPSDVFEGGFYTLDLSSSDPGADTITKWTINWGDGSPPEDVAGNPGNALHFYADGDADRTISATATNEDGTFAAGNTVDVTVHDVAPTLTISGLSDINEGSFYTLDLSASDPGADTITKWTITWGDGSAPEDVAGNPANVLHYYADGDANCTISATATNEDGTFAAGNTVSVTVHNVQPFVDLSGPTNVFAGLLAEWTLGAIVDPGVDTVTQYIIHWGDGNTDTFTSAQIASMSNTISHTYGIANNYTITLDLTDEDGTHTGVDTLNVTVNSL